MLLFRSSDVEDVLKRWFTTMRCCTGFWVILNLGFLAPLDSLARHIFGHLACFFEHEKYFTA